jgi:hypothetical protein
MILGEAIHGDVFVPCDSMRAQNKVYGLSGSGLSEFACAFVFGTAEPKETPVERHKKKVRQHGQLSTTHPGANIISADP